MIKKKYYLDLNDLQYKQLRLPWKKKLLKFLLWFAVTVVITIIYSAIFQSYYGSPKQKVLSQQISDLKFRYSLANKELDNTMAMIKDLKMSDEVRYRPILAMENVPESFRNPGFGGVDRFRDLNGYPTSELMRSTRTRIEEMKNMVEVQQTSFKEIVEKESEWSRMYNYLPLICPVSVKIRRGDGLKFREVHPVLGTSQWHHGQDFYAPYGTEVYATGNGKVIESGWNNGGFGNYVVVDHGYGYQSTYGHLSDIKVTRGAVVKRGDLVGLTGSSGISSGPHLHYQIDFYGQHQNPLNFFNDDLSPDEYFEMISLLTSSKKF
jgi:murein DD-endopeptidase MepM/ murein hydrolase activator NlpD